MCPNGTDFMPDTSLNINLLYFTNSMQSILGTVQLSHEKYC